MARNRGKKALYEVMSKAKVKPGPGRIIEPLHPKKNAEEPPEQENKLVVVEKTKSATHWWNKPRVVQFNSGRIEFSLPYQVVIAIILGLVLTVLVAYRLGQWSITRQKTASTVGQTSANAPANQALQRQRTANESRTSEPTIRTPAAGQSEVTARSAGNNVIVLKQYGAKAGLLPAQEFFKEKGVLTEIVLENGRYFLQTVNTYDNPMTPGTNGYKARLEIIAIGEKYEAPPGFETFSFDDAYGKKVK